MCPFRGVFLCSASPNRAAFLSESVHRVSELVHSHGRPSSARASFKWCYDIAPTNDLYPTSKSKMPAIWPRQFGDIGKIATDAGKGITGVAGQAAGGATQAVEETKKVTDTVGDVASVRIYYVSPRAVSQIYIYICELTEQIAGQVKDIKAATEEAIAFVGMVSERSAALGIRIGCGLLQTTAADEGVVLRILSAVQVGFPAR